MTGPLPTYAQLLRRVGELQRQVRERDEDIRMLLMQLRIVHAHRRPRPPAVIPIPRRPSDEHPRPHRRRC